MPRSNSGLSGPGRLHDLFVTHEAMSPGEWKNGGAGMTLRYGFHPSPFGTAIVIASGRGLAGLAFADPGEEQAAFADMKRRWPNATYVEDHDGTAGAGAAHLRYEAVAAGPAAARGADRHRFRGAGVGDAAEDPDGPRGLLFRHRQQDQEARRPRAPSAPRSARNPVSFVVPCHRALGKGGALTGYHWGITRKQAMLGWEAGQVGVH